MPIPFEDIELRPKLAEMFEMLVDGVSLNEIQTRMGYANRQTLVAALAPLGTELRRALPEESTTGYHLLAQEFMRRQEVVLRRAAQDMVARERATGKFSDEEIDRRFQVFAEQERAMGATA